MEYLLDYGLFLARIVTLLLAFIIVVNIVVLAGARSRRQAEKGRIVVKDLNKELEQMRRSLEKVVHDKFHFKLLQKQEKQRKKAEQQEKKLRAKEHARLSSEASAETSQESMPVQVTQTGETPAPASRRKRVFVLDFNGDIAATAVQSLRQEISTVLSLAEPQDEVLLRLESPGGMVHAYGLASSQLLRIRERNIPLTICVDKVAASGGYMMACLADRLVAAPFAILGSIGVLMQLPNFNKVLKKHDIEYEMITAGQYKRTLTTLGENTEKGRQKMKQDIEEMHALFKQWVKQYRPVVDIEEIATGETWVGLQAMERKMVDAISTSDECILEAINDCDVYEVSYEIKRNLSDKLGQVAQGVADQTVMRLWEKLRSSRFYS